jgi:hypothetical protein
MRSRQKRLLLVVLAALLALAWLFPRFDRSNRTHAVALPERHASRWPQGEPSSNAPTAATPGLPGDDEQMIPVDPDSKNFVRRLRCANYRPWLGRSVPPAALALLCDRRPLEALQVLIPLAQSGDEHAMIALAFIGNFGMSCDQLKPSATYGRFKTVMTDRARQIGANAQTQRRLEAVLNEQQEGPTQEDLEACRQGADEFQRLTPGLIAQFVGILGRSLQTLLGESEADVQIEYDRKTLVSGDAEGRLKLAHELLEKATPASQAEALDLLRQAAATLPSAKTALAECMLKGCPTPSADPEETRTLLTDAASSGDKLALLILAGSTDPKNYDEYPSLPQTERYAWGQYLRKLNEDGCFGTSDYVSWATVADTRPRLSDMTSADASAAQTRTAALFASQLDATEKLLQCN